MSEISQKIVKKETQPTEFEYQVAQTLKEIEASTDLKNTMKEIKITNAQEYQELFKGNKLNAVVVWLDYRSMGSVKKVHPRLLSELEKRLRRPVVFVFRRTIIPKYSKIKGQQKRPYSRTLTVVHEEIMKDLLYPCDYLGKRMRLKTNGKKVFRYILDPSHRDVLEPKLDLLSGVYRKLTGREVAFEFPQSKEFPV